MKRIALIALVACSDQTWRDVRLPDHSTGIVATCTTYQGDCVRRMSNACPEGYDAIDVAPAKVMNTAEHHTVTFRCSASAPAAPREDPNTSVACPFGFVVQRNDAGAPTCGRGGE